MDLNRLQREGRARIDADVPPEASFWSELGLTPRSPLEVRLEAQQAGPDVVVRGRLRGRFEQACRRCLEPVEVAVDEELGRLYRNGEDLAGLCPTCGTNWNESACECTQDEEDERWAPLRQLKTDE
ncbi:MAG: DUF177 domain-containing protein [Gemmatimonadota bacterium]